MPSVAHAARETYFSRKKFIKALDNAEMEPQDLAERTGISVEAIARWMAGIATPRPLYAEQAALELDVDVNDFYE